MSRIRLPMVGADQGRPLASLLARRRSVRAYAVQPLTLAETACLLWAAQGITSPEGFRTAPSAGALYPLEIYLTAGTVTGLAPGVYRYLPQEDAIDGVTEGDRRPALAAAALGQSWLSEAPLTLVIAARHGRTTWKYGERGIRYVHMEAGHAAQNVLLMAVSLSLAAAVVGAFDEAGLAAALGLSGEVTPLYLLPTGHPG